jgi:hypothetical protein
MYDCYIECIASHTAFSRPGGIQSRAAEVIEDLDRNGYASIDTTAEAEQGWAAEMAEMAAKTLYQHANSWHASPTP